MKICEINKLLNIGKEWENQFKGDLLENIFEEYEDIASFCNVFTNDWMPCWKSENKEQVKIYEYFDTEISKLNKMLLNEEYLMIRKFYIYQQLLEKDFVTTLKDVVTWIISMFEDDEEITLELLIDTLDEQIYYE